LNSKSLSHDDSSGFDFAQEMLQGDPTAAINFDRIQKHPKMGWIIFEYLLCDESQSISPYQSHPNRYWKKNSRKFISLWNVAQDLDATLILVNYAKKGTKNEDKIKVIIVEEIDETKGITKEKTDDMTRNRFSKWFRQLNKECL
jgi:hypothetical protein